MAENINCRSRVAIVLPSLDPDEKFRKVVEGLVNDGFEKIVIVDDGSCEARQHFFKEAEAYSQCVVLHHEVNKGKGRALKDAFAYILDNCPELEGAITIDGDGQHLLPDIVNCGNVMLEKQHQVVLGSRDFSQPDVPPRSVAGNRTTARLFKILFGITINDTQTGLRAIPREYLPFMLEVEGERFDYETNMLLRMKRAGISFYEQSIATVYDQEDYSSHYNAVKDSWMIFKKMAKFIFNRG